MVWSRTWGWFLSSTTWKLMTIMSNDYTLEIYCASKLIYIRQHHGYIHTTSSPRSSREKGVFVNHQFFKMLLERQTEIDKASSVQSKYKLHKCTNLRPVHFVWFEWKSWLKGSTAFQFAMLAIWKRRGIIMDLHLALKNMFQSQMVLHICL